MNIKIILCHCRIRFPPKAPTQ